MPASSAMPTWSARRTTNRRSRRVSCFSSSSTPSESPIGRTFATRAPPTATPKFVYGAPRFGGAIATKVTMPQLGESVVEGTVGKWLVKVGDRVEQDQPIVEILTDKADSELPAPT